MCLFLVVGASLTSYLIAWLSNYLILSSEVLSTSHMQCVIEVIVSRYGIDISVGGVFAALVRYSQENLAYTMHRCTLRYRLLSYEFPEQRCG